MFDGEMFKCKLWFSKWGEGGGGGVECCHYWLIASDARVSCKFRQVLPGLFKPSTKRILRFCK